MSEAPPQRRLHTLRGGDGPSYPTEQPDERWPDMDDLAPYWESFVAIARSHMGTNVMATFHQSGDGTWHFEAETEPDRYENREHMIYDPETDKIEYSDAGTGQSWVIENAFGDPTAASSRL